MVFSLFFKFIFKLVLILHFILLRESFLNDNYFLVMHLNVKSFSDSSIILF
jgi:hypothetical protein